MLVSTITDAYLAAQSQLDVDPYAAWLVAVRQFRGDWKEETRPEVGQLRDYLDDVPQEQRSEALQDLIAEHLQFAWQAGQGTSLEPYFSEFGMDFVELASPAVVPAELVEDEFLARYVLPHGDTPTLDEYQRRFPTRPDVMKLLERRCLEEQRYVKLQLCGQGAMGHVFEAFDHHLGRLVAIKQPRDGLVDNADLLRHFAEEARVTAGLEHPSIVSVHEYYGGKGTPFYVMRLASGQALGERIRDYHQPSADRTPDERRLLWNQLLQSFETVCEAIAYAHACGTLHRDLKPGNIIVGEFGETAVLDWGMAKRMPLGGACSSDWAPTGDKEQDTCETTNMVVGTPQYMPPEQAGGISDARSDVFGLGAILYEILTACSPHAWPEGFRPADWLQLVRDAQFPRPRRLKPRLPRDLEAICLKALARNPDARYGNATDLAQDVRRHLAGEQVAARAEMAQTMGWQRCIPGRRVKGET